jgi:hypothetical protein
MIRYVRPLAHSKHSRDDRELSYLVQTQLMRELEIISYFQNEFNGEEMLVRVLRIIILTLRRKEINSEKLLRVRRLYK